MPPAHIEVTTAYIHVTITQIQGGSNMTGTNCDLFTHNQSRSYLNHLVLERNLQPVLQPNYLRPLSFKGRNVIRFI